MLDKPTAHELLWAADLVAWAYGVGGAAREAVSPLVTVTHCSDQEERESRATKQNVLAPGFTPTLRRGPFQPTR